MAAENDKTHQAIRRPPLGGPIGLRRPVVVGRPQEEDASSISSSTKGSVANGSANSASPGRAELTTRSTGTTGFDAKMMAELKRIQADHMKLRDIGVAAAANEARLKKELDAILAEMKEKFGVDTVEELARKIDELEAEVTETVRRYGEQVAKVRDSIREQGEDV